MVMSIKPRWIASTSMRAVRETVLTPRCNFNIQNGSATWFERNRWLSTTCGAHVEKKDQTEIKVTSSFVNDYHEEYAAAADAVERACQLCLLVRNGSMEQSQIEKVDHTPVTVADYGVQALITLMLRQKFPSIPLLGEEDAELLGMEEGGKLAERIVDYVSQVAPAHLGQVGLEQVIQALSSGIPHSGDEQKDTYWVLDPIDGTRGFLKGGKAQYVIGLALISKEQVVVAAMGLPNMPVSALHRAGMDSNGQRGIILGARVGMRTQGKALCERDGSHGSGEWVAVGEGDKMVGPVTSVCISDHESWEKLPLSASLPATTQVVPLCCGSLCKYAAVAMAAASLFVQHPLPNPTKGLKVWDHAAGLLCVTQAGGQVTDFGGNLLSLGGGKSVFYPIGGGVVVSAGVDHRNVLKLLQ